MPQDAACRACLRRIRPTFSLTWYSRPIASIPRPRPILQCFKKGTIFHETTSQSARFSQGRGDRGGRALSGARLGPGGRRAARGQRPHRDGRHRHRQHGLAATRARSWVARTCSTSPCATCASNIRNEAPRSRRQALRQQRLQSLQRFSRTAGPHRYRRRTRRHARPLARIHDHRGLPPRQRTSTARSPKRRPCAKAR